MLGAAGLAVALLSPVLGAVADSMGRRKPAIFVFTLLTAAGSAALWLAAPGTPGAVAIALLAYGIGMVGAEFAAVFNNAMLPSLVSARGMGRLSGIGWGMGYLGGLVALVGVLAAFALPQTPLLGLDPATGENVRIVGPLAAAWLAVFLVPFFLATPDAQPSGRTIPAAARDGLARLGETVRSVRRLGNVARFLAARMLYQDGLSALLAFSGLYASGLFGWGTTTVGLFAILLIVVSVPGSMLGGILDDRLGSKRTVVIAVLMLLVGAVGILSAGPAHILFGLAVAPPVPGAAPFASVPEATVLAFGLLAGLAVGPAQAASRTLMARIAPPEKTAEFFGLYAFSGKATAFVGPLAIAAFTALTGDQRAALVVVIALLAAGLALLLTVREAPVRLGRS